MSKQDIINYQTQLKQDNLNKIASLEQTIISANQNIDQLQLSIDESNAQIADCNSQITELQNGNQLIDEAIAIIEQS
jgi:cell division protein FtsL